MAHSMSGFMPSAKALARQSAWTARAAACGLRAIDLPDLVIFWIVERALDQLFRPFFVCEQLASIDVQLARFFADILGKFHFGHDAVGVGHQLVSSLYATTIPILQIVASGILQTAAKNSLEIKRHIKLTLKTAIFGKICLCFQRFSLCLG